MIGLTEQLLQSFDKLQGHDLLAAVIVGLDHHRLQRKCLLFSEDATLGVGLYRVLPFVFERIIHEIGRSLLRR